MRIVKTASIILFLLIGIPLLLRGVGQINKDWMNEVVEMMPFPSVFRTPEQKADQLEIYCLSRIMVDDSRKVPDQELEVTRARIADTALRVQKQSGRSLCDIHYRNSMAFPDDWETVIGSSPFRSEKITNYSPRHMGESTDRNFLLAKEFYRKGPDEKGCATKYTRLEGSWERVSREEAGREQIRKTMRMVPSEARMKFFCKA